MTIEQKLNQKERIVTEKAIQEIYKQFPEEFQSSLILSMADTLMGTCYASLVHKLQTLNNDLNFIRKQ